MASSNLTVRKTLGSTLDLFVRLLVDSGRAIWTQERIKCSSKATLRTQLFLTSLAILFFELACIRWIPAHVRLLGYFMNFILLAVFLGIGVGILAGRHQNMWLPPFTWMLFALLGIVAFNRFELNLTSTQVLYFAAENEYTSESILLLPAIFIITALSFVPLARSLGQLLTSLPPLEAYAIDILGSLAGIALFFFMSLFSLPPLVWFSLLAFAALFLMKRSEILLSLPLLVGALFFVYYLSIGSQWSPYYRVEKQPNDKGGYIIAVNQVGHQETMYLQYRESFYFRVYDLFPDRPFKRVLILGAGSGSDVAIALANGAEQVDAVEIDPLMHRLGIETHPEKPYDDPRVRVFIEDGRTFLRNTNNQYDLIIYALPDSLTLTSAYSSLRLESFLLTTDSIAEARRHLASNGLVVLYNYYREDWLIHKLAGMIEAAFESPPLVTTYGDWGRAAVLMAGPGLAQVPPDVLTPYREDDFEILQRGFALPVIGMGQLGADPGQDLATDNWPFVYMPTRTIPSLYLGALGMVLGIALVMLVIVAPRSTLRRFDWHFFFLGAAFMLLETRSLVTFALLFGSTWMVNSLVFFAVLFSVLLAILFNAKFTVRNVKPLYFLLFALLIGNYLLPQQSLLGIESPAVRYTAASLLTFAPIFLANIVFSRSFRDTEMADVAFGSNLLGAMAGGVFEYIALASGYRSLLLIVVAFYAAAYWFWRKTSN